MEVFVARQPILNLNKKVTYYELLFRGSNDNIYNGLDSDKATLDVITNSFTLIGIHNLTGGKRAFINFTESLLLSEVPFLLPKDKIVVEILETVEPSEEIVGKCKKFKEAGYMLALDDFVFRPGYEKLIELADFIKVDFLITTGDERERVVRKNNNGRIKFLAEKVETLEDFNEAVRLGYTYFQGYFFSKPSILSSKEISINKFQNFELLKFLKEDNYNLEAVEAIIKKDVSMSFRLLKYINSASLGLKSEIHSIRQALIYIGEKEFIKWSSLMMMKSMSGWESDPVLDLSIVRAKFGEVIANSINLSDRASDVFIMGMFSNIDVLLNQPMKQILTDLPLAEDIKTALLGEDNIFKAINELIFHYEKADWDNLSIYAKKLNLEMEGLSQMYTEALEWSAKVMLE